MALVTTGRPNMAAAEAVVCDLCAGAFFVSFFFVVTRNKIFEPKLQFTPGRNPFPLYEGRDFIKRGQIIHKNLGKKPATPAAPPNRPKIANAHT